MYIWKSIYNISTIPISYTNGVEPIWTKRRVGIRPVSLDFQFCNSFASDFLPKLKSSSDIVFESRI